MRAAALAGLVLLAAACGGEGDPLNPVTVLKSDEDAGTSLPDAGPDAEPPVTPKRTVIQRNPFGDVAESENLLWDGDFEWSSPFADQYGWLEGSSMFGIGYTIDSIAVGPECRSGIKCLALPKGKVLVGIGVGSAQSKLEAWFWARPRAGGCDGVSAQLLALLPPDYNDPDVPLTSAEPDADGWCRFGVVTDERKGKTFLLIENESDDVVVIDDAVLKRAPSNAQIKTATRVPSATEIESIEAVRAELRARKGPHDPPPNAARRALERWGKSR